MYLFLLQIRDLCLGTQFPTIKNVSVTDAVLHPQYQHIETLELCLDLEYSGGFQLSIDANMVLGKAAYLSVKGLFVIYAKGSYMFICSDFRIHILAMTPYCYESVSETFQSPSSGKINSTLFSVAAKNAVHLIFYDLIGCQIMRLLYMYIYVHIFFSYTVSVLFSVCEFYSHVK
jgi:ABC-type cobalt transport system substrate-binding protein